MLTLLVVAVLRAVWVPPWKRASSILALSMLVDDWRLWLSFCRASCSGKASYSSRLSSKEIKYKKVVPHPEL